MRKLTQEEVINRLQEIHKNEDGTPKYIYDEHFKYINKRTDVTVLCPKHGYFTINAWNHLRGQGCKECGLETISKKLRKSKEQFQKDLDNKCDGKYEAIGEYVKENIPIKIRCRTCGNEFVGKPIDLLFNRKVCDKCKVIYNKKEFKKDELIELFNQTHNQKYDYSILEDKIYYMSDNIDVICPKHGKFTTNVRRHLIKNGCKLCGYEKWNQARIVGVDVFRERLFDVNPNILFNNDDYIDTNTRMIFTCKKCGRTFYRTPTNIIFANPYCPNCESDKSRLEKEIKEFLEDNNIEYIYNCGKSYLDWIGKKRIDFYLPKYYIGIECQGLQHFEMVEYFGGEDGLKETQRRDREKKEICEKNNIKLLYYSNLHINYPYKVFEDKNELLIEILNYDRD